jgi:hypothetical protein
MKLWHKTACAHCRGARYLSLYDLERTRPCGACSGTGLEAISPGEVMGCYTCSNRWFANSYMKLPCEDCGRTLLSSLPRIT